MDPVTCHMCQGAIPGKELHLMKICPKCGADLSALVKRRLAELAAMAAPPPKPISPFLTHAALLSLLAPCVSIAINLFGGRAVHGSRIGLFMLGTVCSAFILGGFVFGIAAFFGPKRKGTVGRAITGLLISLVAFGILVHSKTAARDEAASAARPPKGWSFMSGNRVVK